MADPTLRVILTAVDRISGPLSSIERKLGGIGTAFRAVGGTIAVGAFARLASEILSSAEQIQNLSDRTGIGVEALQEIQGVAKDSGIAVESFTKALDFLARANQKAVQGNREAAASFQRLGIDAAKLVELPLDRRLEVIATQLGKVKDEGARLALGMAVLGRGSADLFALIGEGPEKFQELRKAVRETGFVLTSEQIAALVQADAAWDKLGRTLSGSARLMVADLAPAIENIATLLTSFVNVTATVAGAMSANVIGAITDAGESFDRMGSDVRGTTDDLRKFKEEAADEGFWNYLKGIVSTVIPGLFKLKGFAPPELPDIAGSLSGGGEASSAITGSPKPGRTDEEIRRIQVEAKKALGEISRIVEQNRTPWEQYEEAVRRVKELMARGLDADVAAREIERLTAVWHEQERALFAATDAGREHYRMIEDAGRIIEETLSPTEKHLRQLEYLDKLQRAGLFTADPGAYARAMAKASDDYRKVMEDMAGQNDKLQDSLTETFENLETIGRGFARDLTDVMFDATRDIGQAFSDLAEIISKALFTEFVTEPLIKGITDSVRKAIEGQATTGAGGGTGGGIGDALGGLFGKIGGVFGGSGGEGATAELAQEQAQTTVLQQIAAQGATGDAQITQAVVQTGTQQLTTEQQSLVALHRLIAEVIIQGTKQYVGLTKLEVLLGQIATCSCSGNEGATDAISKLATLFGGGKATGGPVFRGRSYIVGEHGPELFVARTGGEIRTHDELHDILRSEVVRIVERAIDEQGEGRTLTARASEQITREVSRIMAPRLSIAPQIILPREMHAAPSVIARSSLPGVVSALIPEAVPDAPRFAADVTVHTRSGPLMLPAPARTAPVFREPMARDTRPIIVPLAAQPPARSGGGPVFRDAPAIVGEHGAEVYIPRTVPATAVQREVLRSFERELAGVAERAAPAQIILPRLRDIRTATERIEGARREATREIVHTADRLTEKAMPATIGRQARALAASEGRITPAQSGEYRERTERHTERVLAGAQVIVRNQSADIAPLLDHLRLAFARFAEPTVPSAPAIIGRRQSGGPVFTGTPFLVGEGGPEVFVPNTSGQVQPVGNTANITFNITSLDPRTAASTIVENRQVIIGIVRQSMERAGRTPSLT